ncbi:MAG: Ribosomal protein S23 [Candidatus Woesebacteria bacterium GW2011_GWA2_40_7b]|uniref:Ribosomal protein S23 n=1 Tax=Candidatus Woesebacteria bacterium GW2011_GWA2_40_7b TaxID=1618563 RepID=A0A0G0T9D4_9BACT|nr:MAG: Ribosomal protein S23 [Candidatus Woesebacteria bacterium GW2011_GWA2_40_7b]
MKNKITKFEDLKIWQESHRLAMEIYVITRSFPKDELYGLVSQLRRSSLSIPANIIEGFYRYSTKELIQFLINARGSTGETIYHLLVSKDLKYINEDNYSRLRQRYEILAMSINALINSLRKKK